MLRKLVKYELRATRRMMLPCALALLFLAVLGRFSLGRIIAPTDSQIWTVVNSLTLVGYALAIMAVSVVVTVMIIQRFYKNLTGDEGYLMFTLPVKPRLLILSKLLVAAFWEMVTFLAILASLAILVYQPGLGDRLLEELVQGWALAVGYVPAAPWYMAFFCVLTVLSSMANILMIYAAIAMGHTMKGHRIVGSVLSYFGLGIVIQLLSIPFVLTLVLPMARLGNGPVTMQQGGQLIGGILLFVAGLVAAMLITFFLITNYIFSKQLNLE